MFYSRLRISHRLVNRIPFMYKAGWLCGVGCVLFLPFLWWKAAARKQRINGTADRKKKTLNVEKSKITGARLKKSKKKSYEQGGKCLKGLFARRIGPYFSDRPYPHLLIDIAWNRKRVKVRGFLCQRTWQKTEYTLAVWRVTRGRQREKKLTCTENESNHKISQVSSSFIEYTYRLELGIQDDKEVGGQTLVPYSTILND